jgi:hypothetical protein
MIVASHVFYEKNDFMPASKKENIYNPAPAKESQVPKDHRTAASDSSKPTM